MGPPGTPLAKYAFVVDNIVTDDKPNPYKNKVMQLSFYQFPVFEGSTNLVSADYSQLVSDPLPCSSLLTYDDNGNVLKNIFTFGVQTFTLEYTHESN